MAVKYDEGSILSLSPLEHIRLRPGMYIGRLGNGSHIDDGIYILLKEIIDNAIDEFVMRHGSRVVITVLNNRVSVRDYGRGIPLGSVVDCVSKINTGAKYTGEAFQYSVGLNGVGTKAVNALSSYFKVVSNRGKKAVSAVFERGKLVKEEAFDTDEADGTYFEFVPDEEIFGEYSYNMDYIRERLWAYAYLNIGLTISFNKEIIKSQNGLMDLLSKELGDSALYEVIHYKKDNIEFAFTHTNGFGENYFSYVNGQHTSDGGTHLAAFKEGILKGVNEYYKKSWNGNEIRDGIVGAVAIKIQDPVFESQTKNKLGNTDVKGWIVSDVKEAVVDALMKNTKLAQSIQAKIISNEKIHKEEQLVRNGAREKAKKTAINIEKLKECKYHLTDKAAAHRAEAEKSMIFLTEGDSASGTINTARDARYQAVFSLRGKLANTEGMKRSFIYKHDELYNIMCALGIEDGIENLRYAKVIIATDADTDGFHIRNLIMTYFFTFFEELVTQGHLYILETPLFRVRNKNTNIYCYSEKERDEAARTLKGAEITRFKGLGEISAKEFGQFIGENMRLVPVSISSIKETRDIMTFCMGDNTPKRREYIMENLI
ncbi:MAG TPA: type IIA DNA topoisomerase subunit B [Candidatus Ornithospirochaeta avicola]|uniref:DNA topoisomerase (ATP-hydrolyzing) n=1 Tax=Candidatus Ornithospirochaeta avicola TaxID=2840896 RepID=A0A9D1PSH2_9SPIO|nr:type IIA DNA topoisomerase subunit B [Candidatus Ornithospirochaeta avicola]